ncbi:MAG: TetR/AcrR family transcriptional regulator [Fibrobacteria bacterium]|nr:TetR/AcrR family transcriptional regulator [Fibrobacteria bacterium]
MREASRQRREGEKQALRQAILDAASEVFLEKGLESFSMRLVASKIGYSATTIYHHFKNKEDLLRAILDQSFGEFAQAMQESLAAEPDPSRRMGAMGKAYVRFGVAHPTHYQLMYNQRPDWLLDESSLAAEAYHLTYGLLLEGVKEGVSQGWLPPTDPRPLADWMWATVHGLVMLGITEFREDPDRLEAAMTLFDLAPPSHEVPQ